MTARRRLLLSGFLVCVAILGGRSAVSAQGYTPLHDFNGSDGSNPFAGLIRASDGNFYGTTRVGGAFGKGVVFRMDSSLNVVVMHSFTGQGDGAFPASELVESWGYLYGTSDADSIFRMDFLGNLNEVGRVGEARSLCVVPEGIGLTAAYGSLWGVTPCILGSLYRVDSIGVITKFGTVGQTPEGELLLASDGYLYGTTLLGGSGGTLFRADAQGNVSALHNFDSPCGGSGGPSEPSGRLLEFSGELYGATQQGGPSCAGAAYRMNFLGNPTLLHGFSSGEGHFPFSGMARIGGSLYGTTTAGGQYGGGSVYKTDSAGNTSIVHEFGDAGDGYAPEGELLADGSVLYGTTIHTASGADTGRIFLLTFKPMIINLKKTAGPVRVAPGVPVQIRGLLLPVGGAPVRVAFGGLPASNVVVEDPETLDVVTPVDLSPGTLNDVTLTTEDGSETTLARAWLGDFLDVPTEDPNHDFVERAFRARLMDGRGEGNFCQGGTLDRGDVAVMALKAKHGPAWAPPACTGQFRDVDCPGPDADWIEAAVAEGIAEGCTPRRFCPNEKIRRETLPQIMLKTAHGADYEPPPCNGIFRDVPCPSKFADGIEQLYREGVVEACNESPLRYCPNRNVDRVSMARFATRAFRLP